MLNNNLPGEVGQRIYLKGKQNREVKEELS